MRTLRFLFLLVIAYCCVTISCKQNPASETTINGHEYVDLGLSVKWATCNIGAFKPYDYGDYIAWGDIEPKYDYIPETSKTSFKDFGSISGNPTYDAARASWGSTWRLPTIEEMKELVDKCEHKWTTIEGHDGYKVIGPNGNSIFLPVAGMRCGMPIKDIEVNSLEEDGEKGYYWSATPDVGETNSAYVLNIFKGYFNRSWNYRYYGCSIRPVTE